MLSALENILLIVPRCWSLICLIRDVSLQDSLPRSSIIKSSITGSWNMSHLCCFHAVQSETGSWQADGAAVSFLLQLAQSRPVLTCRERTRFSSRSLCVVLEVRRKHTIGSMCPVSYNSLWCALSMNGGMICYIWTILEKTLNIMFIIFQRNVVHLLETKDWLYVTVSCILQEYLLFEKYLLIFRYALI